MALTVMGFVTGGTKIDKAVAVDVSYPGFFPVDDGGWGPVLVALIGSFSRDRCF